MLTQPHSYAAPSTQVDTANLREETNRARGRLSALDGVRGIAILLVLLHNAGAVQRHASSTLLKALYFLHAPGWIGVQLFFVLSGFLITGILLDSPGFTALRGFWIRRALRIFPVYYAFLFLVTIVAPRIWTLGDPFSEMQNKWWYWTYLNNWVEPSGRQIPALRHCWSLAIEEQFYFLWPLAVLTRDRRAVFRLCLALAAAALLVRLGLLVVGKSPEAAYQYTAARMDSLTFGGAAAVISRDARLLAIVAPRLRPVLYGSAALLAASWPVTRGFNIYDFWVQTLGYVILNVLFSALVLLSVAEPEAPFVRRLSASWLRWLGTHSYAMYVLHFPIVLIVARRLSPTINGDLPGPATAALLAQVFAVSALSAVGALASWNLLERRVLSMKDRWAPLELRMSRAPTNPG
jgi:peptidoglycan/LPS O-acetylase OafA/YrhL